MKSSTLAVTAAVLASSTTTTAFQATSPLLSITHHSSSSSSSTTTTLYEYIPSGFTKQSWAEFKKKEAAAKKANLGRVGPKGFQSRSMQSFQEALERGEAEHLLPVFNAKEKVAKGLLKVEDIPYMQRGESWLLIVVGNNYMMYAFGIVSTWFFPYLDSSFFFSSTFVSSAATAATTTASWT